MGCGHWWVPDVASEHERSHTDWGWVLLIYSLPATPSRKRAFVWRELKKLGAVYLRDGVAVLPSRPDTAAALRTLRARVEELDGHATVVENAALDGPRVDAIVGESKSARASEYTDVHREAHQLWEYMQ